VLKSLPTQPTTSLAMPRTAADVLGAAREFCQPARERRPYRSRLAGAIRPEDITGAYRGLGYLDALAALNVTPTEYYTLVANLPNRSELLTITAPEWKKMTERGMTPRGVFTSRQTAINLTLDVLSRELPTFLAAHESRDIAAMAALYRKHVVGYRSRDGKTSGQKAFFNDHGLRSVLINTDQIGATKSNSAAALLSVVLPGLVDATNPNALQPNEVERGYWNDVGNVRRHFFGALDTVPGFAKARADGNREAMVQLWKEHVCSFESGTTGRAGQVAFFIEKAGLGGFLCDPHPAIGLGERGLLPLVKLLLPEMVGDELELPWFARSEGFWRSPVNVRNAVLTALYVVPGFREAHVAGDIGTMCRLYRSHVINFRLEGKTWGGQKMFFERNGALEAFGRGAKTLGLPDCSIHGVLRAVIPELCDTSDQEHIRRNEVAARFWNKESMRSETLRALYTIPGFQVAHDTKDAETMCALYRAHVSGYKPASGAIGGQRAFFWDNGLIGLLGNARADLGFTRKNSPYELMNLVLPELFNPQVTGSLSERELTQYYWSKRDNAVQGVLEALYEVEGFKAAHERGDVATMADLYRAHVIGYQGPTGRNGQQAYFVEVGGLRALLGKARADYGWTKAGSPAEALRLAVPELVDSKNPDSLRRCEIEHYLYNDIDTAREAGLSGLFTIVGFQDAYEKCDVATMATLYRMHVIKYVSTRAELTGQKAFFREVCGLGALLARPHPELGITKLASCAQVLTLLVPALTDRTNPDALRPTELERGYWSRETVRAHMIQALDGIPSFSQARLENDIATMAQLYRNHVISYSSGTDSYGGQRAFLKDKAQMPYVGYVDEATGERVIPTLDELLNDAIPGLVDDENDEALYPPEVTLGYWSDPDVCVRSLLRALYTVPGFKAAHEEYDIAAMADLYRRHVVGFAAADGTLTAQRGFYQLHNLLSIANHKQRLGLDKGHLFQELLELSIPGLVDDENPDALRVNEISQRVWNDRDYVVKRLRQALYTIPGFQEAQSRGDIQTLASLYRTHVLQYRVSNGGDGGQSGFYRTIGRLWGGIVQARYHGHVSSGISADLINSVCSGLLDDSNPDAVRSYEITGRYWTDDNRLLHLERTLRLIPGWQEAVGRDDIAALARLYRSHVLNFFDANRDVAGQFGFFVSHRVPSVLYAGRGMQTSCSYVSLLQSLYPALVDSSNPDALHPQELEKRHLRSIESIRSGVIGALYKIPRFADAHRAGDVATMFALYRKEVVSHQSSEDRLGGQLTWFTEVARMGSIVNGRSALRALGVPEADLQSVPAALIQIGCPEIADAVRTLQSERHLAFVRGALFERLGCLFLAMTRRDLIVDRVGTRLEGPQTSLYPDGIVARTILDFKWGRSYQNMRDTVAAYAEASHLQANRSKVEAVDEHHPVTIVTLTTTHSERLPSVPIPHRIVNVIHLLDRNEASPTIMDVRRLLNVDPVAPLSALMQSIFENVQRLERLQPEDPERNFYVLNQLIEELASADERTDDSIVACLRELDELLGSLVSSGVTDPR
jgi:hypothetical protein